jgi:hypothetical protein
MDRPEAFQQLDDRKLWEWLAIVSVYTGPRGDKKEGQARVIPLFEEKRM